VAQSEEVVFQAAWLWISRGHTAAHLIAEGSEEGGSEGKCSAEEWGENEGREGKCSEEEVGEGKCSAEEGGEKEGGEGKCSEEEGREGNCSEGKGGEGEDLAAAHAMASRPLNETAAVALMVRVCCSSKNIHTTTMRV
jgi:hypothetical protein